MVAVDDGLQLLAGQRTVDRLAQDVPGTARLGIDDYIAVALEGQFLVTEDRVKHAGGADVLGRSNVPSSQGTAGAAGMEDHQITPALAIVDNPYFGEGGQRVGYVDRLSCACRRA